MIEIDGYICNLSEIEYRCLISSVETSLWRYFQFYWLRFRYEECSVSDPEPVGSGSTSGNVDLDPGSKKNVINSHTNQPVLNLIQKKIKKKKIVICSIFFSGRIRIRYPGSGSADPDPHQNEPDQERYSCIVETIWNLSWKD